MTTLASPRSEYPARLNAGFRAYQTKRFAGADVFDPAHTAVFHKAHVDLNIIVRSGAPQPEIHDVRRTIPLRLRHRWFGSMRSSQAIAQSVFGNLMEGGAGRTAFDRTRAAVKIPELLRCCSWQAAAEHLRKTASLDFLTSELEAKYGF